MNITINLHLLKNIIRHYAILSDVATPHNSNLRAVNAKRVANKEIKSALRVINAQIPQQ